MMQKKKVEQDKLTLNEEMALRAYTDSYYYVKINEFLRKLDTEDKADFLKEDKTLAKIVRYACSAFHKLRSKDYVTSNDKIINLYTGMVCKLYEKVFIPD